MKNNRPSFFIVGSPKCGTTALAKYLSEHDEIFISSPKEPHYFATNFNESMRIVKTEEHYLSLFKHAKKTKFVVRHPYGTYILKMQLGI